jgi:hypothetical protein
MAYFITGLVSFAVAMLTFILQGEMKENKRLKAEKEKEAKAMQKEQELRMKSLENGVVCLLRKELIADYEKWMDKGHITQTALEHGLLMYDAYKSLGGNGMIEQMKEEIQELPIK